jgi:hypothetical protein
MIETLIIYQFKDPIESDYPFEEEEEQTIEQCRAETDRMLKIIDEVEELSKERNAKSVTQGKVIFRGLIK